MRDKEHMKKLGFSLMEIILALAIVGILAMITIPIITRQLTKADEYSYYVAYKTVEKLAGQIVAGGDDEDDSALLQLDTKLAKNDNTFGKYLADKYNANVIKVKTYLSSLGQKFAYTEFHIFKRFFPKTVARTIQIGPKSELNFTSATYDEMWLALHVCKGEKIVKKIPLKDVTVTNEDGTTTTTKEEQEPEHYKKEEFNNCVGFTLQGYSEPGNTSSPLIAKYSLVISAIAPTPLCNRNGYGQGFIADHIYAQSEPDAQETCEFMTKYCTSGTVDGIYKTLSGPTYAPSSTSDDDDDDDDGAGAADENDGFVEAPSSSVAGICSATSTYTIERSDVVNSIPEPDTLVFTSEDCKKRGYINTHNRPGESADYLECVCDDGLVPSFNDDKVCVPPCDNGFTTYASISSDRTSASKVCCKTDFNDKDGVCCPDHSMYTGGGNCECLNGYSMEGGACTISKCAPGSTLTEDPVTGDRVCVANASLVKASRFCQKVSEHWNINSSYCSVSGFTELSGAHYNSNVFSAAKGTNGTYLSINSQVGAFDDKQNSAMTPNIVFANGLKMWILGDKSASIPGLSTTTKDVSGVQNDCKSVKLTSPNAAACSAEDGYFCSGENRCYKLADKDNATVVDARNCCVAANMSDYAEAALEAGTPNLYQQVSAAYAISGFTIFIDINGDKGSGTLWEDVFPFYIATNGTVYPGYPLDAPKSTGQSTYLGGNSEKQLPVDVYYYNPLESKRKKVIAFPNVSFARGVCSARKVSKYTPYCLNLGSRFKAVGTDGNQLGDGYIMDDSDASKNPCDKHPCFVTVRKRLTAF